MIKVKSWMLLASCASLFAVAGEGWNSEITAGATVNDGNSDNQLFTVGLGSKGVLADGWSSELAADYQYGETEGETSADKISASAQANKELSESTYGLFTADYLRDDLAGIDKRLTVGPGIGLVLMKNEAATLAVELGPVWILEEVDGVENDDLGYRLAQKYERQISETAKVWQSVEGVAVADDSDDYYLTAVLGVESAMNEKLSLRIELVDRYDNLPAMGKEDNDLSIVAGLSYKL